MTHVATEQPQTSEDVKYVLFDAGRKVKFWEDLGRLGILKAYWEKGYIFSRVQCCVLEKTRDRLVNVIGNMYTDSHSKTDSFLSFPLE